MSAIRSSTLFIGSGISVDQDIPGFIGTTWIIREIFTFCNAGTSEIDISEHFTGALLYRHVVSIFEPNPLPDLQLRHLVYPWINSDYGLTIKPYGNPHDVVISGYILNGIYAP
jgi:hypothetical protein